jgi:transposase
MANKIILMSKIRQILRLYTQGESKRKISELTGVSRNTLKKYILEFRRKQLTIESIGEMSDHALEIVFGTEVEPAKDSRYEALQLLLPGYEKELKRKGVTVLMLWKQYRKQNPEGYELTQFYRYWHRFSGKFKAVMHINHKAGDKMYIDFAGEKLSITDRETGELIPVEVFAAILGCSQLMYAEAVGSQKKEELIRACENALQFYGGVPAAIVPDNLKSAVTKSSKYEPTINETFADFADHYSTAVLPARAYRPKDKSLVEGMVKIIYRCIYTSVSTQVHFSLPSLNAAIIEALEINNRAPFKGRDYSRRQQFEELERSALQPLPAYRYEFKQQAIVTVMKNGHVCLGADKHYYSVPYRFIGKKVKILFTSLGVEVFYHYERIASHQREFRKYHYTTQDEHLASAHRYITDWTAEKFIEQARTIHEDLAEYINLVMEGKQHPEQAYKSCAGILSLARKVGPERLINACRRAHSFGVYNYPIVQQILGKNLDRLSEEEQEQTQTMPNHHNIRGNEYYQ